MQFLLRILTGPSLLDTEQADPVGRGGEVARLIPEAERTLK